MNALRIVIAAAVLAVCAAVPAMAQNQVNIWRFYNTDTATHFYTAAEAEMLQVVDLYDQLLYEGAAFSASDAEMDGAAAVHRFYNTSTNAHFYTINQTEADSLAAYPEYTDEGTAYWAWPSEVDGTIPLYRFYNTDTATHFYTVSEDERDAIIASLPQYTYEGEAYWVQPALPVEQVDMTERMPLVPGTTWDFGRQTFWVANESQTFGTHTGWRIADSLDQDENGYLSNDDDGLLLVGFYMEGDIFDFSADPYVISRRSVEPGERWTSPAGVSLLGVNVTSKAIARETVETPAATFLDALKLRVSLESEGCDYVEHLWFAEDVGIVKIERVSETPANCDGCFLSCGCFDETETVVEVRELLLQSFTAGE